MVCLHYQPLVRATKYSAAALGGGGASATRRRADCTPAEGPGDIRTGYTNFTARAGTWVYVTLYSACGGGGGWSWDCSRLGRWVYCLFTRTRPGTFPLAAVGALTQRPTMRQTIKSPRTCTRTRTETHNKTTYKHIQTHTNTKQMRAHSTSVRSKPWTSRPLTPV